MTKYTERYLRVWLAHKDIELEENGPDDVVPWLLRAIIAEIRAALGAENVDVNDCGVKFRRKKPAPPMTYEEQLDYSKRIWAAKFGADPRAMGARTKEERDAEARRKAEEAESAPSSTSLQGGSGEMQEVLWTGDV